jgi:peptidyl-prolyl cis-trans isomerase SurA
MSAFLSAQKSNVIDGVVWVVGDEPILRSNVEKARIRAQYEGARIQGDPYCVIPEMLAINKLYLHQAKIDSISANQGQVEAQVNATINMYIREIGSVEKVEEYFNQPLTEIKEELRRNMSDQMVIGQVQESLVSAVKVTPSEVRLYYNELNQDSIPTIPAKVEVQIVTIEPPIPLETIEETKQRLRDFADRVNRGEADFSMLARLYSEDLESAKQGGELGGFLGRGSLVPEYASAAFALTEPGRVSRVVETEFGYHIIQLIERRDDRVNTRHILLRPKVSPEVKQKTFDMLDSVATMIRTDKITFENAASMYSADNDTRMNGGNMVNGANGMSTTSQFEYQELPPEIAKIVYDMKEGEISVPFSMFNQKLGREVFAIVKLKKKLPNHKANLIDDYQVIKSMCESYKKGELIEKWIQNKIQDTYIMIVPEWRDCDFKYDFWIK